MVRHGFSGTVTFDEIHEDLRKWELQISGWGGSILGRVMACAKALGWENANRVADRS